MTKLFFISILSFFFYFNPFSFWMFYFDLKFYFFYFFVFRIKKTRKSPLGDKEKKLSVYYNLMIKITNLDVIGFFNERSLIVVVFFL
jgi:hypothetical protein